MKTRLMDWVRRNAGTVGIGVACILIFWLPFCLFILLATTLELRWWQPEWVHAVKNALLLVMIGLSAPLAALFVVMVLPKRLRRVAQRKQDGGLSAFLNAWSAGLYALIAVWGVRTSMGFSSPLLLQLFVTMWLLMPIAVVVIVVRRDLRRARGAA